MLRDSILRTLETMPQLPYEEKVELRPDMRAGAGALGLEALSAKSIMMDYGSHRRRAKAQASTWWSGPNGKQYTSTGFLPSCQSRPLSAGRCFPFLFQRRWRPDREASGSNWQREHLGLVRQRTCRRAALRNVLQQRIETVKAVVVLWTENSIGSKWVRAEADLADKTNKLICLRDPKLEPKRIPMPFAANDHIIPVGDMPGLIAALALKGAKPRI